MKKRATALCIPFIGICLFFNFSCTKLPRDFDPRDGNNVYTGCRVNSINGIAFTYNKNNDPVTYIHDNVGTGNPNLFFKYDNRGRLTEFAALEFDSYEFLHRYTYYQQRIVVDTMYIFGEYGVPESYAFKRISYPAYDNLNRIVQDSVVQNGQSWIIYYPYRADGNLISGSTYDDKLNPHRTNKVWMFIDRDYSVNNSVAAATYNSSGLPLMYPAKNGFDLVFAYFRWFGATSITYDCK